MLPEIDTDKYYKKIRPFFEVRVVGLIIFATIILLVTWSGVKVLQTNYELEKKMAELSHRNNIQKLENENLKLENSYYESDQYLELTARRQFNKALPGERVYIVPQSVAMNKTIDAPKDQASKEQSKDAKNRYNQNIDDWIDFLFHRGKS